WVVVLVGGSTVVTCLWILAENRRQSAETNLIESNRQRERAGINLKMARKAVDDYSLKVSQDERLLNFRLLRKELLQTAVPFYERFVEQGGDDPTMQAELAKACMQLGIITRELGDLNKAITCLEQARSIFAQVADDDPTNPIYRSDLAKSHAIL